MRFGVFLVSGRFPGQADGDVLRRSVRAAELAEEAGFDDVWFAEHHFMPYGVCPSAITLAAHVLGRTSRIGVGTAVSVLSTTHPVALAEQWAMLDAVSGGRLRLGLGRGGPWQDLEVFGTGLDRYETGFEEALDVFLRATTAASAPKGGTSPSGRCPWCRRRNAGRTSSSRAGDRRRPRSGRPPNGTCRCCSACTPMTRKKPARSPPTESPRTTSRPCSARWVTPRWCGTRCPAGSRTASPRTSPSTGDRGRPAIRGVRRTALRHPPGRRRGALRPDAGNEPPAHRRLPRADARGSVGYAGGHVREHHADRHRGAARAAG
ncbi:LLM class flavin-dependent oxidoreductase [Amycolatopsis plumensis]|uniref:LLM class flavin-dependent oxidoreductase n=1 Tax=Amycolatopsis plumensis TaxID=236508 RepID=UPI003620E047